jgi:hypothetical protein
VNDAAAIASYSLGASASSIRQQIHINNPTAGRINAATHDTAAAQLRPRRESNAAGYGSTQPDTC